MKVLLTGAFGNVGLSTLDELLKHKIEVRIFDLPSRRRKKMIERHPNRSLIESFWGDLCNLHDVEQAIKGVDAIIHLGAIIPPLADKNPDLAYKVNVGGTQHILEAVQTLNPTVKLFYTSSISIYGDRREHPFISIDDPLTPCHHDEYGKQKKQAEELVRKSSLDWTVFRLTYITSMDKLQLDPLMYEMPLETCIEICDTKDVAFALVNALLISEDISHQIFHIAGGESCRTTFGEYLSNMFEIFGLGYDALPAEAFSRNDFHCGWMDTKKSQSLFQYQRTSLETYFIAVKKKIKGKPFFIRLIRPLAIRIVLNRSPYFKNLPFTKRKKPFLHSIRDYLNNLSRTTAILKKKVSKNRLPQKIS